MSHRRDQLLACHDRHRQKTKIYTKVKAALRRYALQELEDPLAYEVHVICGTAAIPTPTTTNVPTSTSSRPPPLPETTDQAPAPDTVLFFAELSNDDEDVMCCPVSVPPPCAGQLPRCLYCDHEASRIVHPAVEDFHGRELEFEKMVCREDLFDDEFDPDHEDQHFTNYNITEQSEYIAEWVEERCYYDDENDCCDCDD